MRTVGLLIVVVLWTGVAAGFIGDCLDWLRGLRERRYRKAKLARMVASGEAIRRVK